MLQKPLLWSVVRNDSMGSGHFGAKRKHGFHRGLDLAFNPAKAPQDQKVVAPCDAIVVRRAYPYVDRKYQGILLKTETLTIKIFYFTPHEFYEENDVVFAGEFLGYGQDISKKHGPDMQPHIHMEVAFHPNTLLNSLGIWNVDPVYVNPAFLFPKKVYVSNG